MEDNFSAITDEIKSCKRCKLFESRKNAVVGGGIPSAPVMLIGEAPGADEDENGVPFIGRSGRLLMQLLEDE